MAAPKEKTYTIVNDVRSCKREVDALLQQPVIAVDAEGVSLSKVGPITLIQVAIPSGHVILFDVYSEGRPTSSMFEEGGLKELLESSNVLKVMHSSGNDGEALKHQYDVTLNNVFDTQVAEMVLEESDGRLLPSRSKLPEICQRYLEDVSDLDDKDNIRIKWQTADGEYWATRPLTQEMINYASADVRSLIPEVHEKQQRLIRKRNLKATFQQRVQEELKRRLDDKVKKSMKERFNENIEKVLRKMEEKYSSSIHYDQLTDEDEKVAIGHAFDQLIEKFPKFQQLKLEYNRHAIAGVREGMDMEGDNYAGSNHERFLLFYLANKHPNPQIRDESKPVLDRLNRISLLQINRKYKMTTPFEYVSCQDRNFLSHLKEAIIDKQLLPVVWRLHWLAKEADIDDDIARLKNDFVSFKEGFNPQSVGYFRYLKSSPSVPGTLKAKAGNLLILLQANGLVLPPRPRPQPRRRDYDLFD